MKNLLTAAALALVVTACGTTPTTTDVVKAVDDTAAKTEDAAAAEAKAAEMKAKEEAAKAAADAEAAAKAAVKTTVVDTAVAAGKFMKLAAALEAAGLIAPLRGAGPFTVFAPNDEAFAKISDKDLAALLADKKKLTKVLNAHVVSGKVMAADVKPGKVKTLGGAEIEIVAKDGKVMFGGSTVTATDIDCTNGVIHVIDTVVMPK